MLFQIFGGDGCTLRSRVIGLYLLLAAGTIAAWAWALVAFRPYPILLGTAFLAYSFGLRHAVDADHIAAIDNVTRKLMQDGRRPVAVGFFFSLGHSAVVVLACTAIALTASAFEARFAEFRDVGGLISTSVSAFFLFAIAIMNVLILRGVYRSFRRVTRGGRYVDEDLDLLLAQGGLLARLFRPLFRLIRRSWHMLPLGFLFGLGFETATEVALLGLSSAEAAKGLSVWSILVFPALFTAGMTLVDTTDGILMLGAYGWAFVKPIRKLYYNMTITLVSVIIAVLIGGIEALGLIGRQLEPRGMFWRAVDSLNENFGSLGYLIIFIFAASWLISALYYRARGYDALDAATPSAPRR
jgi:high-affinity nickel-transport protein